MKRFQLSCLFGLLLPLVTSCQNVLAASTPTPTPAPAQISVVNQSAHEGNSGQTLVTFRVGLSKTSSTPVQVTLFTQDGTARAREDYVPVRTTISIPPRALIRTFQVAVLGDTKVESNETFFIQAQNSSAGYVVHTPAAICTIINDDIAPTPTPKPTATPRPTSTPKPTATPRPTPTATATPRPTVTPTPPPTNASIRLVTYADTWADARERWWDMGSARVDNSDQYNAFNDWLSGGQPNGKFDYSTRSANVILTYQRSPGVPYFVGHISAKGLKPNFVYQLKLAGKPVGGPRGTGQTQSYVSVSDKSPQGKPQIRTVKDAKGQPLPINGDDWANQQLGYVGRWWNDSNASGNTNAISDPVYQSNTTDTIYGYQFLGDFVTDSKGNAETDIQGNRSYHITWQEGQYGNQDVFFGSFTIKGFLDGSNPTHYYAYGRYAPSTGDVTHGENGLSKVSLWYELEGGRPNPIVLPSGTYHCRLLITEETFHNMYGQTDDILGGKWKTVMATEDRDIASGAPDSNPANDIVFTIP